MNQTCRTKAFAAGLLGLTAVVFPPSADAADRPPPGVEQLLPRGRIAAISSPRFVSAKKAKIPDDAWVLGVEVDGEARAYSLNLLNSHEVVNDRLGNTAFAAVW